MPDKLYEAPQPKGFTPQEWLRLQIEYLDSAKANKFVSEAKIAGYDDVKKYLKDMGFKDVESYYNAVRNSYAEMANNAWKTNNWTILPEWGDMRKYWVGREGTVLADNRLVEAGGVYYEPNTGMPVDPRSAQSILNDVLQTDTGLTDYQKAQLTLDIRNAERLETQATQAQSNWERQFQYETQQATQQDTLEQERQKLWSQYELDRANRALEFERGGPMNWIKRWYNTNAPNPYEQTQLTQQQVAEQGWMGITEARQKLLQEDPTSQIPTTQEFISDPQAQEVAQTIGQAAPQGSPASELAGLIKQYGSIIQQQQKLAAQMQSGEVAYPTQKPTAPNLPANLAPFTQAGVAGQPISQNLTLPTPSGQQWGRADWRTQQQYGGLADWVGGVGNIQNILQNMQSMATQAPSGVGSKRWIPTRQRM